MSDQDQPVEVAPARPLTGAEIQKQFLNLKADLDFRKWCVEKAIAVVTSEGVTAPAENGISIVAKDIYEFVTAALPREKTASPEKP
jgi:hypothetical protein